MTKRFREEIAIRTRLAHFRMKANSNGVVPGVQLLDLLCNVRLKTPKVHYRKTLSWHLDIADGSWCFKI